MTGMDMGHPTDIGLTWAGEFADKSREKAFRRFNWVHDFPRLKMALILGALGFWSYTFLDYAHLGQGPGYVGLLAGRTLTAVVLIWTVVANSAQRYSPAVWGFVLAGEFLLSSTFFVAEYIGADAVHMSYAHALLIVIAYYLVIPDRFLFCLIATGYTSVTFLAAAWLRGDSISLLLSGILMLAIGHLLGLHQRRSANIELRRRFTTIEEQTALNRQMIAAERIAQDNANLFRNVFEATPFPLIVSRQGDSRLLHANRAAADFFKIDVSDIGRIKGHDLLCDAGDAERVADQANARETAGSLDIKVRTRDGETRWVEMISIPFDFHGEPAYLTGLADVTERFQNQKILERAKQEAEAANRAKSEFLANVSHELRTPLNAILGFAGILRGQNSSHVAPEAYAEYVSYIQTSGEHLLQLINDLLDLSKIEAGEYRLNEDEQDLTILAEECCRIMHEQAAAGSLDLNTDFRGDPMLVMADARCIRQFLLNTISNAIKFTEAGGSVTVSIDTDDDGWVILAVTDTGIGIAADDLERAMTPFCQVDGTLSRKHEGTGLGLPLARKMAELHGGEFDITSSPGEGTRVAMRLPADRIISPRSAVASL